MQTDLNTPGTFTAHPNLDITDGGVLYPTGIAVTMNYANHNTYTDYYWESPTGNIYKFVDCVYTAATAGTHVTGGTYTKSSTITGGYNNPIFEITSSHISSATLYSAVKIINGAVEYDGIAHLIKFSDLSDLSTDKRYYKKSGVMYEFAGGDYVNYVDGNGNTVYTGFRASGYALTATGDDTYKWNFYPISVVPNTTDSQVQGIWSGRVGETEYICAACNNRLWALSETDGVWTKLNLGTIFTENKVHLFGFDSKLYILNGTEYKYWDASTYKTYTYTADGTESGDYYITVGTENYKFSLASIEEDDEIIFSENGNTLKLNGVDLAHTTGAITSETDLTVVEADEYYPLLMLRAIDR